MDRVRTWARAASVGILSPVRSSAGKNHKKKSWKAQRRGGRSSVGGWGRANDSGARDFDASWSARTQPVCQPCDLRTLVDDQRAALVVVYRCSGPTGRGVHVADRRSSRRRVARRLDLASAGLVADGMPRVTQCDAVLDLLRGARALPAVGRAVDSWRSGRTGDRRWRRRSASGQFELAAVGGVVCRQRCSFPASRSPSACGAVPANSSRPFIPCGGMWARCINCHHSTLLADRELRVLRGCI